MTTTLTFPTITIRCTNGRAIEVPAEQTEVPGLYITPDVHLNHLGADRPLPLWRPGWRLTHGPSGSALPYVGPTPEHVRELAHALTAVRADWSDLPADLDEWPAEFRQEINRVGGAWEMRRHRRQQPQFFWPMADVAPGMQVREAVQA